MCFKNEVWYPPEGGIAMYYGIDRLVSGQGRWLGNLRKARFVDRLDTLCKILQVKLNPRIPRLFSGKFFFWPNSVNIKGAMLQNMPTVLLVWLFVVSFEFSHLLK